MDNDSLPSNAENMQRCQKILDQQKQIFYHTGRLHFTNYLIRAVNDGSIQKKEEVFAGFLRDVDDITILVEHPQRLRITSWNSNGVRSRIAELSEFVDKPSPDIVLIQETHLGTR
ncbi:hypothetical protein TNIN_148051 [Trichonephila inaurata madagascariensis]|uniref:Endonuclease/exonuclease/phosphatase domain-containing protein n=1 Tax=Trichonephila inaurata madagascariensis TaxID=2747483 RepID=A0A8X6XQS4_9ARAC|nr:hypothetical protein TNIN_148051 [Trichonephila inaurata madagascariensis]